MHELSRRLVHPMYYDRRIDEVLARTLEPGGALYWLLDHVCSEEGADRHAHIQFRRNRRDRRLGSIQRLSPAHFANRRRDRAPPGLRFRRVIGILRKENPLFGGIALRFICMCR